MQWDQLIFYLKVWSHDVWATAVLNACQGLPEVEDTSVHLLAPILGVIVQVVTCSTE